MGSHPSIIGTDPRAWQLFTRARGSWPPTPRRVPPQVEKGCFSGLGQPTNAPPPPRVLFFVRNRWIGGEALTQDVETDGLALSVHRGEPESFDRFVGMWEPALYGYAFRILQNTFDAQEVVQDAFLRAHRALTRQYDEGKVMTLAVRPWLYRIARNLALNRRRGVWNSSTEPLAASDDAGGDLERRQDAELLESALSTLPTESRELIFLRFMEEMPYGEIARTTGLSETQLRGKVFRSLKLLRRALESRGVVHAV
jgi:RNA polymerase sigma-70 factor, ECF subfamily